MITRRQPSAPRSPLSTGESPGRQANRRGHRADRRTVYELLALAALAGMLAAAVLGREPAFAAAALSAVTLSLLARAGGRP